MMIKKDFFTDAERPIVKNFHSNLQKISQEDVLELIWKDGTIEAKYDTDYGDWNDETDEYSQYYVFAFQSKIGNVFVSNSIQKGDLFEVNYHNFPDAILLNGEKIS